MAQVQITDLPIALPLTGTESVPIVQNGVTVRTTTGNIANTPILSYAFLMAQSTPDIPQSRYISVTTGLSITDNGAGSSLQINMTGAALSLNESGTGIVVKTGPNTVTGRSLAVGSGLTIANADGTAGNPTIGLDPFLQSLSSLSGTGILAIQSGTVAKINILGTTSQTSIANGDGSGDVTVALATDPVLPGSGAVTIPAGTTAQQPTGTAGMLRYNSTTSAYEGYFPSGWRSLGELMPVADATPFVTGVVYGETSLSDYTLTPYTYNDTVYYEVPQNSLRGDNYSGTTTETLSQAIIAGDIAPGDPVKISVQYVPTSEIVEVDLGTITSCSAYFDPFDRGGRWNYAIYVTNPSSWNGTDYYRTSTGLYIYTIFAGPVTYTIGNTFLGSLAGGEVTTGSKNVILGTSAGQSVITGDNNIVIGAFSDSTGDVDNEITLGNSTHTNTRLFGSLAMGGSSTGTTGQVLISQGSGVAPIWGSPTGGTVTSITAGTGLTGGTITTSGTIAIDGTVVATLVGLQTLTNKTISGANNTLTNIGNSSLTNSSITINGNSVSLGGSTTVTATASNPLTIGTGLSGASYNGSTPVTIAIDSTVATLTGVQTLTNKTISGASNTLSNIGNSSLTNSSITIGSTSVSLGGSITTFSGTSIDGSTNTLSNIGNSSLTNSSVTFNGVNVALGGSGTITAASPNALTIGTGLTGTSYNGSTAVTIAIDSTVATLTGTQTLTNKTMSGASNTFTNIGNSSLTNSSITINGNSVSLGGSTTVTSNTTNSLTFNNGGAGAASGTAFNGSTAYTISYNTVGASPLAGSTSLTTLGTITTGVWNGTAIANANLANSSVTIGTTNLALGGTTLTLGGLTSVTLTQDPTSALQAATKQYVDAVASGINFHNACYYATTADLGSVTYNNGSSGVGATLTNAGTQAALVIDGHTFTATDATNAVRILVKNETNGAYNGVYTLTNQGSGSTNWVLTRATDYDSSGTGTNEIDAGDLLLVLYGTANANTSWVQQTPLPITVGTTALVFVQFGAPTLYSAGTGLTLAGTTFSITNTGVTNASYGTASSVPTIAVNTQGQITSASNTAIAINGNQITSGTVGSAYISGSYTGITGVGTLTAGTWTASTIGAGYGGTGLATYTAGDILYASGTTTLSKLALGTTNYVLTAGASAPQYVAQSTLSVGSATTATTATNVAGGAAGSLVYQTGSGATSTLALGTSGYVLTAGASAPTYVAQSTLSVGSATNATNATNTAITAATTGATNYLTFVTATTGNLPQLVNSSITANAANGTITGGIAGGAF